MAKKSDGMKDKLVEEYDIQVDKIKIPINILMKDFVLKYHIILPQVDVATNALLDDIKDRLITGVDMKVAEILDSTLVDKLKNEFSEHADVIINEELPNLDEDIKKHFIQDLINELMGLDEIDYLLNDPNIEEIVLNGAQEPVRIFHKKHGWMETNIVPGSEDKIKNYANTIARRVGREITTLNPLLDAHLMSKDRANAILTPISTKGNTITIRKFARDPWTCTDFIKNKTVSDDVMALIWLMIQYEMNILISGGTGSGKTSFLNTCMPFMPPNHRIISIEDTRELQLPGFLYWCPLTTREPNPEGKGEVSMLDLLVNTLRMRPDRIVMGEIRKRREAEVLFEAMHTGHSVYATLHADTCEQTITRLVNPPIDIPDTMLEAVHLNVVMFRDRRRGIRRVSEVGEFVMNDESKHASDIRYMPNVIYKWDAREDTTRSNVDPLRLYTELYRHTGLNRNEVQENLEQKKNILNYMVKHGVRRVDHVGTIMNRYYVDLDTVVDMVENDRNPKTVLGDDYESSERD